MKKDKKTDYHHGSLKQAIIEYAVEHVRDSGWEEFSMREAAREIGVSPGAAYRHFRTLDDLLFEIVNLGFAMLDTNMQTRRDEAADARDALIGIGMVYVEFSRREPRLFNLMFSDKTGKLCMAAEQEECRASNSKQLVDVVLNYFGPDADIDVQTYCDFFWVVAHGIASLEATTDWRRSEDE
ncbi:MAG: TetR/AcrR family transcriptional regulator [Hyphomicrobiales bacterium]|nr:TetR/AcrR family transcriptional regulator [Hyphomicrobiales bacterium]